MHTLLAGFTLGAYHSGLFWRSISYLLNSALASASASSACHNMCFRLTPCHQRYTSK